MLSFNLRRILQFNQKKLVRNNTEDFTNHERNLCLNLCPVFGQIIVRREIGVLKPEGKNGKYLRRNKVYFVQQRKVIVRSFP